MGTVWVAKHLTLDTEVAVKFISKELANDSEVTERFQREAKAVAQIKSPNVVQILDHGVTDEGLPYIVMELLEGQTLADMLEEVGTIGPMQVAAVITQVARALSKAHQLGIIHRDIKPGNVFLLREDEEVTGHEDQHVKVLDFGIAKQVELPKDLTIPGMVIGTPGFMSRDQVLDSAAADKYTDMWALAVCAYYALTAELPFYGDTMAKLVGALVRCEFKPPSEFRDDVDDRIDAFFARAFAREQQDRFGSAIELAIAFREAAGIEDPLSGERLSALTPAAVATLDDPFELGQSEPPRGTDPMDDRGTDPLNEAALDEAALDEALAEQRADDVGSAPTMPADEPRAPDVERDSSQPVMAQLRRPLQSLESVRRAPNFRTAAVVSALGVLVGVGLVMWLTRDAPESKPETSAPAASLERPAVSGNGAVIASGRFDMGCDFGAGQCAALQQPRASVELAAFIIDRSEVTVAQYRECVSEETCGVDGVTEDPLGCNYSAAGRDQHPVNCVDWKQADTYCRWTGGTLPTEAQWERAARGTDGRAYPWGGEKPSCTLAVMASDKGNGCGKNITWQAGSFPAGASPSGAQDMAGNVREWVADWYAPGRVDKSTRDPLGPKRGTERVVRGGGLGSKPEALRVDVREHLAPAARSTDLGFRCARTATR
jgi:serine/threonine protein kinase